MLKEQNIYTFDRNTVIAVDHKWQIKPRERLGPQIGVRERFSFSNALTATQLSNLQFLLSTLYLFTSGPPHTQLYYHPMIQINRNLVMVHSLFVQEI